MVGDIVTSGRSFVHHPFLPIIPKEAWRGHYLRTSNDHCIIVGGGSVRSGDQARPALPFSPPHPLMYKITRATVMLSLCASNEGLRRPRVARA